jgi:DNA-binding response OmpR family regulator
MVYWRKLRMLDFSFLRKKTILVVEDDAALRKILVKRTSDEKWRVIEAVDGRSGLSSALEKHPDLILLDLMLPGIDGITLLAELRKDEWGKSAKVIIMSNLIQGDALMKRAEGYGVIDYVEKADMSLDSIVEKIRKTI